MKLETNAGNGSLKVLLCGATFSGNLGGEALYDSIVDELKKLAPHVQVSILSKYPKDDAAACAARGIRLYSFSTIRQLISGGLFFMLGGLCKLVHISGKWLAHGTLRSYYENDVLVDASGIAFSDDRPFSSLVINTLWFLPAFISGIPIVKVSQSLGPYKRWYVKMIAKPVLSRMDTIICRGASSFHCTSELLQGKKIYNLPDCAFCLQPASTDRTDMLLSKYQVRAGCYIAIGPSFVVQEMMKPGEYVSLLANCIAALRQKTELPFLLIPHSRKHSDMLGVDAVHDDLYVCGLVEENLRAQGIRCSVVDEVLTARELKSLIGNAAIAIGSRYHFLIAALSSGVPSLALGWGHKYKELFDEFGLEAYVQTYRDYAKLTHCALQLNAQQHEIKEAIMEKLPSVKTRSSENEAAILYTLKGENKSWSKHC